MKSVPQLLSTTLATLVVGLFSMSAHSQQASANEKTFPAVNQVWRADFGQMAFDLEFQKDSLTYYAVKGAPTGEKETVPYTVTPLRDGQFAVRWVDRTGYVVHVEDFKQGTVHSFVTTLKNGQPLLLQGTFTKVR